MRSSHRNLTGNLILCLTVAVLATSLSLGVLAGGWWYQPSDRVQWATQPTLVRASGSMTDPGRTPESGTPESGTPESSTPESSTREGYGPALELDAFESELTVEGQSSEDPGSEQLPGSAKTFLLTFVTVFVAEMGDKTQLATMLMSAQSQSPWGIFLGSASALVAASVISVVIGGGLGQLIPPETLQLIAGIGFIGIGLYVLWEELVGEPDPEDVS